jgi:hypothetical protein
MKAHKIVNEDTKLALRPKAIIIPYAPPPAPMPRLKQKSVTKTTITPMKFARVQPFLPGQNNVREIFTGNRQRTKTALIIERKNATTKTPMAPFPF